jgi:hypothetical protein
MSGFNLFQCGISALATPRAAEILKVMVALVLASTSILTLAQDDKRKVFERQVTFVEEGASKHLRRAYKYAAPAGASAAVTKASFP